MKIQYIVLTRFCVRYWERSREFDGMSMPTSFDPMNPENLRIRSTTIRTISYASLKSQEHQDFDWVIMIEPDLDQVWKDKLAQFTSAHENMHVHELQGDLDLCYHTWLRDYIDADTEYLVTTLLDDDDALCPEYMKVLDQRVRADLAEQAYPLRLYGHVKVIQWDMEFNPLTPYGRLAPEWHRNEHAAVSCGLSLVARYPEIRVTSSCLRHAFMHAYFSPDPSPIEQEANVQWVRRQIRDDLKQLGRDEDEIYAVSLHRLDDEISPVMMSNHGVNLQKNRIHESKDRSDTVVPGQTFGNCVVDWEYLQANADLFEVSLGRSLFTRWYWSIRRFLRQLNPKRKVKSRFK